MLDYESNIIENHHDTEDEFDYIDFDILSENGLKCHLSEREDSSSEVKDDVGN